MELSHAELSSPGPVRATNEEAVGFWEPLSGDEKRSRGAIAALADGAIGPKSGELASRQAVDTALATFREAGQNTPPKQLLADIFSAANLAVYEKGMAGDAGGRLSTTLSLVILRGDEIAVGSVGDSRAYLVRQGEIRQLSTDDTYLGMQQKFGLVSEEEARNSEHRATLTSSVGQHSSIRIEPELFEVVRGDRIVLCSKGLYRSVADSEIAETVSLQSPAQACRRLISLAESRSTGECLSIQVIAVGQVEAGDLADGGTAVGEGEPRSHGYELQPGQTLDDRFLITEVISRSGMATIFKATDALSKKDVAIKIPFLQYESDPGFYSRFVREGEIGSKLDHPYILKFVPVENRSRPYLVTEYLRGYTLANLLKNVQRMPEADALKIASRICDALTYMHAHDVIHRDLKPQNVMICHDGTIRILDFGIARSTGRRFTFSGFTPAMGTPEYMAPEQVKGKRGDERTDLYSLGAILYQMVVGEIPFGDNEDVFDGMNARVTGDPVAPRKKNRQLSEQVEEIILHAMEREPKNRYPSAAAMKEELEHPEQVALTGRWQRLLTPSKWRRYWKSGLLLGCALAAILFGFVELILLILRRGP
jgi:serine/threonine-protein kinase